jgi:phosphonate transport system substrate-binding protein
MISPKETFVYYRRLLDYLAGNLDRDVELVQRKTYGEVNELIGKGLIDLAFICSGPYAFGKERFGFELLATAEVQGSHFYHSYLIVKKDSPVQRLEDLKGRVFAFTDPDSLTGKLAPTHWLAKMRETPETFFGKVIYTYSHDNSILAVTKGLVDGAAVDGLIWEYYQHKNPSLTSETRIIKRSDPYGIPPVVASKTLSPKLKERVRQLLFSMHKDPGGGTILRELMIDRFVEPRMEWYEAIPQMERKLTAVGKE